MTSLHGRDGRVDGRRGAGPHRASRPSRLRWILAFSTPFLVAAAVVIAAPHAEEARLVLRDLPPSASIFAGVAVLAEAVSLTAASRATRATLGPGAPTFRHVLEVDLVAQGVRSVLPGGAATSAGLRISLLRRFDVPVPVAASAATTGVVVSNIMLGAVFLSGVATTAWRGGPSPGVAVLVGVVLLLAVTAGLGGTAIARRPDRVRECAVRLTAPVRRSVGHPTEATIVGYVDGLAMGMGRLRSVRTLTALLAWVGCNWAADLVAFGLMLVAAGARAPWPVIVLAYGLANVLATVPITPGALGLVEGTAVTTLHVAGVPTSVALLGVLGWRAVEYWLPMLAALVVAPFVFASIHRHGGTSPRSRSHARRLTPRRSYRGWTR
ncbi:lysylphosphatidylglycerol synthase transmembrane domain-containing protein [Curtobacterium pusillum]|uniref:lysylphosphatidylglycerol synthase transmembrane domain-containing protein n=1 Tax=Curtobacterium pusillum TaxID=69373 RepID=UPI0011A352E4|nr:lysylphosphatidylglycerol synthase transmembrane domain-containing protein [Curtobacterium pusillum]